jgi:hypothetical protein
MAEIVNKIPDCLVLKIEEVEYISNLIDTTLYVLYDKSRHVFVVRGRRRLTPNSQSSTYSFECEFAKDLAVFIEYIICSNNTVNEVLYNYDNLPNSSNKITYEFLQDYEHVDYEISGYNNKKLRRKRILKNLRMLRNVYNYY